MNKRIEELDVIKGILIIFIVLRHLCTVSALKEFGGNFFNIFYVFSEALLIVFMLISGYCYKPKNTVWQDIKHRFKTIIVPLFIATTLFSITYFIKYVIIDSNDFMLWLNNIICNYLGINGYNLFLNEYAGNSLQYASIPYWYLYELFSAYLLFIPIYKLLKDKKLIYKFITFICLLGLSMISYKIDIQNVLVDTYWTYWSYFIILINIFGFASVLLLGTILKEINFFSHKSIPLFIICAFVFAYLCITYGVTYAFQYGVWGPYGMWSIPITTLAGVCLMYVLFVLANYIKKYRLLNNALTFVGKNSLDFLLLHYGIGEIISWIFSFGYDIYVLGDYPQELFAYWHGPILIVLVFGLISIFIIIKKKHL